MTATMFPLRARSSRARQRGAALMVSMIMVLLVLMLAVVGMRVITLESRIAANMLQSQRMRETADGALREAERTIFQYGMPLVQCASGTSPLTGTVPCFTSEAKADLIGLNTSWVSKVQAQGFTQPAGYWYPRYISTVCPKGSSATSALDLATTGCTEFYELNAQANFAVQSNGQPDGTRDCGTDALCLRSTVNLFIK